jgi:hypothetical protein
MDTHIYITSALLFFFSFTLLPLFLAGRLAQTFPSDTCPLPSPPPAPASYPKDIYLHTDDINMPAASVGHIKCSGISWFSGIRKGRKERREQNLFLILEDLLFMWIE